MSDETADQEIRFSLYDLALIEGDQCEDLSEAGRAALRALVMQDPRFADQLAKLRAMMRDVGGELLLEGCDVYEIWETLMAEDSWEHALGLLSDEGEQEVWWYRKALHLAATLAERAEDPSRILAVKKRLETAQAAHRLGKA